MDVNDVTTDEKAFVHDFATLFEETFRIIAVSNDSAFTTSLRTGAVGLL